MQKILRSISLAFLPAIALSWNSLQASEACCSLTDAVEAACQAPCQGCTDATDAVCDAGEEYCRCCSGCPSLWNAYVGAIFLTRDRPDAGILLGPNPPDGTSYIRGSDFDFDTRAGIDVVIARRLENGDQIEARYFGIDDTAATQNYTTNGTFRGGSFFGVGNFNFNLVNTSKLNSAELNWKRSVNERLTMLAGFRYLGLDDTTSWTVSTTLAQTNYEFTNRLYGGQLGAELALLEPTQPFQLNVIAKAGIYGNDSDGRVVAYVPVGVFSQAIGSGDTGGAFVGDLQIVASYQFNSHLAVRGGYQMLWIDNVALSSDNAANTISDPFILANSIDHDGHVFYHGAMIGFVVSW